MYVTSPKATLEQVEGYPPPSGALSYTLYQIVRAIGNARTSGGKVIRDKDGLLNYRGTRGPSTSTRYLLPANYH
jgi:hypothetical protein